MEPHGILKAFPKVKRAGVRVGKEVPQKKISVDETVDETVSGTLLIYNRKPHEKKRVCVCVRQMRNAVAQFYFLQLWSI